MRKNSLQSYLEYYTRLTAPGFAVLITGEWGSGKTYQVLNTVPPDIQCHVSLFGMSSAEEVYGTVFSKMYPGKYSATKLLELTKDVTSEMNGVTLGAGAIIGSMITPFIKQTVDNAKVIIFDDLERCPMGNKEILGVINQYVEHHQCKVIILAHDKQTHKDFTESKEKIIGHTIQVEPQIDEASVYFFKQIFKLNNFKQIKPIIIDSFKRTNCKSLRILKYVINDCGRLLNCLEVSHIKNLEAMKALFSLFCVVNIEYRAGNITIEDIKKIPNDHIEYSKLTRPNKDIKPEEHETLEKRTAFFTKYYYTHFREKILDNDLLARIMKTSSYPANPIKHSLNYSKYFIKKIKNPTFLTILKFDSLDSDIVRSSIRDMFNDFAEFKITEIGEMLHCFSLSYFLSEQNEIEYTFDELLNSQLKYIDSLLEKDLLPPNSLYFDPSENRVYQSSYTFTYLVNESYKKYFDTIVEHLMKSRAISRNNRHPIYTEEILTSLDTDLEKFKTLLLGSETVAGKYANIDIMKSIDPEDFMIHWLMLPVESWSKVGSILHSRYANAAYSTLKNEKQWLSELCLHLFAEAERHRGIDRARIKWLIPFGALHNF